MNSYEEFRQVISSERENLTRLSDFWNSQVKCDKTISKDTQGRIRAAVGKTRLLLAEKFKQFEGLIEQSEHNTSEKEISINDLQGFWDLVLIQVNEVKDMFRDLDILSEKLSADGRKLGKSKSREDAPRRELTKGEKKSGSITKKKSSNDYVEHSVRKTNEITEKNKERSAAGDLKKKVSISKL